MKFVQKIFFLAVISLFTASPVLAADNGKPALLDADKFSVGGGLASNSATGVSSEIGFQVFGAYDLDKVNFIDGVDSSVEFGFGDLGVANFNSIWGNYVIEGPINGQFGWLGRVGLDIGDDSGLMFGFGANYIMNPKLDLRLEYVIRDDVNALQFNVLYHL